jgi:hypothetical protein
MRLRRESLLPACLIFLSFALSAQEQVITPMKDLRPGSAAVFKNGLAFVVRHGQAQIQDGRGRIDGVPSATLGSLWIATNSPGAALEEVVAFHHTEMVPANVARSPGLLMLLQANIGKTVTVTRDGRQFTGEIMPPEDASVPRTDDDEKGHVSNFVLLRAGDKITALSAGDITGVEFAGKPNLSTLSREVHKSLRFRVKNAPAAGLPLTMGYMERGLGWTPSYLIELRENHMASITMQSVVVNDAEDLEHTDLFFVVGYPNFKYANTDSPMTLRQSMSELLTALNGRTVGFDANVASQLLNNDSRQVEESAGPVPELTSSGADLSGDSEQDLFLYSRPDATLKKGERGLYNVFTTTMSYDEIYEWQVEDVARVDAWGNYQTAAFQRGEPIRNAAWHALKLKNSSAFPWTTAPAMVVHGNRPIAQEILSYTPKGATGLLRLTVASDIHVDKEEVEIDRVKGIVHSGGNAYDAITVEGTLRIHNYKSTDAPMRISRNIVGEVVSASNDGKFHKTATAIQALNPNSVIEWEFPVKSGEQIRVKYRYKFLVRS